MLLKKQPWSFLQLPFYAFGNKAHLKEKISETILLDVTGLPYHQPLIEFLREEKGKGRQLLLVTGSTRRTADAVQAHVPLFDEVIATGEGVNLTGKRKADLLVQRFGEKGFDYIGNSSVDMHVWSRARNAIAVNAPKHLHKRIESAATLERVFHDRPHTLHALLKAIRPHQWLKNILIFVPVVTAHRISDPATFSQALLAFAAFCLCTSGVYLLNDLLDVEADRMHVRKRHRPIASGDLPIPIALIATPLFTIAGIAVGFLLPPYFLFTLLLYFIATFAYSFWLKQLVIVDVLILAGLYTVRIVAGHTATGLAWSPWLLLFSMFFFFSLALIKRYSELESHERAHMTEIAGRGYVTSDRVQVAMLGSASGFISVLILAFYIVSESVAPLYRRPEVLWLLIPLMLYWISRIWLLAHRGQVHDDPIVFALKDTVSYFIGVLIACVLLLST